MLKQMGDISNPNSLAARLRRRRFAFFRRLVDDLPRPLSILDVGGDHNFWQRAGYAIQPDVSLTLVNLGNVATLPPNVTFIQGDARSMPEFANGQFDVVFSNSTIEHVGDFEDQARMAQEVQRVGRRYFVQTPNLYFPIEPHFLFPYFQFLPVSTRVWLLQHFNFSRMGKVADRAKALALVKEIRLLTEREMRTLFPDAEIYREYFSGFVKSIVAYKF
jgi:hypothetical protein